jgi:hypothetical protein
MSWPAAKRRFVGYRPQPEPRSTRTGALARSARCNFIVAPCRPKPAQCYRRPFLPDFFGFAFLDGADFWLADLLPPRLPENAVSHPSAYFEFVPTRVIVTALSLQITRLNDHSAARPTRQPLSQLSSPSYVSKRPQPVKRPTSDHESSPSAVAADIRKANSPHVTWFDVSSRGAVVRGLPA